MNFQLLIENIWKNNIGFIDVVNVAAEYEAKGDFSLSAAIYLTWINSSDTAINAVAYYNLGVIYFKEKKFKKSVECYRRTIEINPKLIQGYVNLGIALEHDGLLEDACAEWARVEGVVQLENIEDKEILISCYNNIGRVYEGMRQYEKSLHHYNKSLLLKGRQKEVLHHAIFSRARQCLWPVYDVPGDADEEFIKNSTSALAMIAITDDAEKQLELAKEYAGNKAPVQDKPLSKKECYPHKKIRVGYCSSDFSLHPVSMLTVEIFELHNRDKFEVYGFCWSPEDGSDLRKRVVSSFDHYIQIGGLSDEEAAQKIRECEIDILFDLQGQTAGARMKMLAWRPAPIQITYLGLPATTGIPSIDYVIADDYLVPPGYEKYYSEKVIRMPGIYQSSDTKRISNPPLSRKEYGLPENGFVFCSFNNNYKYTLEVFSVWMNILKAVKGSVLWLLSDNPWAEANLKQQASVQGVSGDRLIFSKRALPPDYLAKYQVADLFLDTFPFNAGTTANDALWMELPILTVSGRTFASRMAGALLTAANLPELIAKDLKDYEKKAIEFASKKSHASFKKKLKAAKNGGVLFDMPLFVKNLENKLEELVSKLSPSSNSIVDMVNTPLLTHEKTLLSVAKEAQDLNDSGDVNGAKKIYSQWLEGTLDPLKWAGYFNLAILQIDSGEVELAQDNLRNCLRINPGFEMAKSALHSVQGKIKKNIDASNLEKFNLYKIAWNTNIMEGESGFFQWLDNTENKRPDWMEYWPIREFLLNSELLEEAYYGFFSPKFSSKTGLDGIQVKEFVNSHPGSDVYIFSPQPDMSAFFLNSFEQGDIFDNGFYSVCEALMKELDMAIDIRSMVMDSRRTIFSNYFVAKKSFWMRWLTVCEGIFAIAEKNQSPLAHKLNEPTSYQGVPRKVFVIERIASLLLHSESWKCVAYNTFDCVWSALPTANFKNEAVESDAAKIAFNETQNNYYINSFSKIRGKVFGT